MYHQPETPRQIGDRLLEEDRRMRRRMMPVAPTYREAPKRVTRRLRRATWLDRATRAIRPWLGHFDHPVMDAIGIAFLIIFAAIIGAFLALMSLPDTAPPRGRAFEANTATSRPAADPLPGGGALGETK